MDEEEWLAIPSRGAAHKLRLWVPFAAPAAPTPNVREMSALRDEFCKSIKDRYPAISAKADAEYQRLWDDFVGEHYSYSWFEALANALNKEMNRKVPVTTHQELLVVISSSFESGDEAVRQCIDVAFVENLFWQVTHLESVIAYWTVLPENLKELYIAFHGRGPL
ncbi:MAG: hypothetical protein QM776_15825 [Rhodocyclaceae bacterium]